MFDLSDNFKLPLENLKTNQITAHYLLHRITAHVSKTYFLVLKLNKSNWNIGDKSKVGLLPF